MLRRAIVLLLVAFLILFTALRYSEWGDAPFPSASLLAFTMYVAGFGVVLAAASVIVHLPRTGLVAALCSAALLYPVSDRLAVKEQPVAAGPTVTVTTVNLRLSRADPGELADVVRRRRPDVLLLQELTDSRIASYREAGVFDRAPLRISGSGRRLDDTAIASRWEAEPLRTWLPDPYRTAAIDVPGSGRWTFASAHPLPPETPAAQRRWRSWLDVLPGPTGVLDRAVVGGDFNATLDHVQLRNLLDLGWRDAALERGKAMTPTWHGLPLARLTIDHVLVPRGVAVRAIAIDRIAGTDHSALTVRLQLPPA